MLLILLAVALQHSSELANCSAEDLTTHSSTEQSLQTTLWRGVRRVSHQAAVSGGVSNAVCSGDTDSIQYFIHLSTPSTTLRLGHTSPGRRLAGLTAHPVVSSARGQPLYGNYYFLVQGLGIGPRWLLSTCRTDRRTNHPPPWS